MKKYLILISLIALFIFGFKYSQKPKPTIQKPIENKLTVFQKIFTEDLNPEVSVVFFKYEVESGETALELLQKTTTVKAKGEGVNAYVTEINNLTAQEKNKEYWAFYVNGKLASVGAGSYVLKDQDKIEWKIEKY